MRKSEVISILTKLKYAYPKFEVDDDVVQLWIELFKEMPYEEVLENVKQHILTSVYPPRIAQIAVNTKRTNTFIEKWNERLMELNECN